jgi:hypothetical protein
LEDCLADYRSVLDETGFAINLKRIKENRMRYTHVLDAFTKTPWAIVPERLAILQEIIARHMSGEKLDPEATRLELDDLQKRRGQLSAEIAGIESEAAGIELETVADVEKQQGLKKQAETRKSLFGVLDKRIEKARYDISDIQRREIAGRWVESEKDIKQRVAKINALLGPGGLTGELKFLEEMLPEAQAQSAHYSQDAQIFCQHLRSVVHDTLLSVTEFVQLFKAF